MIIDHQSHWYPRTFIESLGGDGPLPRAAITDGLVSYEAVEGDTWRMPAHFCDLDAFLEDMAANGVGGSVVSPNTPGQVDGVEAARARGVCEELNEAIAAAQREHPDKLIGLAMLPMQDPDAAIAVLDRGIGELDLRGVCLLSNIAGAPVVSAETEPVFARVEELGVPLFLHPSHNSIAYKALTLREVEIGLAWMFDTAAAAEAMIFSGLLDRLPGLTVVHPHLGGVLPYVVGRAEEMLNFNKSAIELPIRDYLKRNFYVDCVGSTPQALPVALDIYGEDRVLFASDYPWMPRKMALDFVADNLTEELADKVLHRNRVPGIELPGAS
ncbi:MAG: amidohydrolase family protein [Solirubrobacterales bacterium]